MNINNLISIVKKKLEDNIIIEKIEIEDKSFLHKNHVGNSNEKFHLKLIIHSKELTKKNKIERTKKIYSLLDYEIKNYIHSLQILIS